jgi:hypothetical protein
MGVDEDAAGVAERGRQAREAGFQAVIAEWTPLLRRKAGPDGAPLTDAEERRFWELVVDGLRCAAGDPNSDMRAMLVTYAALGIREALDGFPPKAWRPESRGGLARGRGRRVSGAERVAREAAAAYAKLVTNGSIVDEGWKPFLIGAFVISPDTLERWLATDPGYSYDVFRGAIGEVVASAEEREARRRDMARGLVQQAARRRRGGL